ncbi:MAG: alpha/beta hydrolase [Candidatus Heimdallarchaeota archaeon]|nr:alpha/beta hydrolase [Candidatus Heimdallarchaeota archaeon]
MLQKAITVIKTTNIFSLIFNSVVIILGIVYLFFPGYSVIWNIFGYIYAIAIALNFYQIYYSDRRLHLKGKAGGQIYVLGFFYLIFQSLFVLFMNFGNMFISITYSNLLADNIYSYLLVSVGFFGVFIIGLIINVIILRNQNKPDLWIEEYIIKERSFLEGSLFRKILRILLIISSILGIVAGFLSSFLIIAGVNSGRVLGFGSVSISQLGESWGLVFISCSVILIKLIRRKAYPYLFYPTLILGLIVSTISFLPISSTPFVIRDAQNGFDEAFNPAFNGDWKAEITPEIEEYFLEKPYYLMQYYLGVPPKECVIIRDVPFFYGSQSSFEVDQNISLFFDVYLPLNSGVGLPGDNSTLIRIHGGGLVMGDKGISNMMQMNKYFAAQGYIVFDIQYGLIDTGSSDFITPEYRKGNFTKEDIIRHVGNFTYFLADHANDYGANLDSVFISGGSAGGFLASAAALMTSNGTYSDMFSPDLTINGLIPYYPANRISVEDNPFDNPGILVDENSPACLIYHGAQDGLVHPEVSLDLYDRYIENGNTNCTLILMPFAGHASDVYFTGNYNQIFLYFMERFLYLFH